MIAPLGAIDRFDRIFDERRRDGTCFQAGEAAHWLCCHRRNHLAIPNRVGWRGWALSAAAPASLGMGLSGMFEPGRPMTNVSPSMRLPPPGFPSPRVTHDRDYLATVIVR